MADTKGMQAVKYVGHKEAVQVPTAGPTYKFPRGTAVMVPGSIAGGLLKQPEKFQPADAENAGIKNASSAKPFVPKEKS